MEFKNDDAEMKRIYYESMHPYGFEDIKYGKHQNKILTTHKQDIKERTDTYNENNKVGKFNIQGKSIEELKESFKSVTNGFSNMGKPLMNNPYGEQDVQKIMNSYSQKKEAESTLGAEVSKYILKALIVGGIIITVLVIGVSMK